MRFVPTLLAACLVVTHGAAQAAIRCVPVSHPGSCDERYATVQAAVDAAAAGDVVDVAAGVFSESVTVATSITLRGAQAGHDARSRTGPETVLTHPLGPLAIVNCQSQVQVDGFTLSGAVDPGGSWSGLWFAAGSCGYGGAIWVENNVLRDNIVGLWTNSGSVTVRRNRFLDNDALPGTSQGLHSDSATEQILVEKNAFEGHLDDSVSSFGSTSVILRGNHFDRRVRLAGAPGALIEGNIAVGGGGSALIELAGNTPNAVVRDNLLLPSGGAAILVSDSAETGVPSSGVGILGNCFGNADAIGIEVTPGGYAGTLSATGNWWGAPSGPSGAGPGSGAAIAAAEGVVQFAPFETTTEGCGCTIEPDEAACDDENACTVEDACSGGLCVPGAPRSCDDGNPCTDDSCDPATGCVHTNNATACDDGVPCTAADHCTVGVCRGTLLDCDDGNICTADQCVGGTCTHVLAQCGGVGCNLSNCGNAGCVCDDGEECTIDSCTASGCTHVAVPNPGPDGPIHCYGGEGSCAVQGYCFDGHCSEQGLNCDSGSACVLGYCRIFAQGCVYQPYVFPEHIGNLTFTDDTTFGWATPPNACQPQSYEVATGSLTRLPVGSQPALERCIVAEGGFAPQAVDPVTPSVGEGFWYIVRATYWSWASITSTWYGPWGPWHTSVCGGPP